MSRLNKPNGLIDPTGLGKPQVLGEEGEQKFRIWAINIEDYEGDGLRLWCFRRSQSSWSGHLRWTVR